MYRPSSTPGFRKPGRETPRGPFEQSLGTDSLIIKSYPKQDSPARRPATTGQLAQLLRSKFPSRSGGVESPIPPVPPAVARAAFAGPDPSGERGEVARPSTANPTSKSPQAGRFDGTPSGSVTPSRSTPIPARRLDVRDDDVMATSPANLESILQTLKPTEYFGLQEEDIQRIESLVEDLIGRFSSDIEVYFPSVEKQTAFAARILGVFMDKHMRRAYEAGRLPATSVYHSPKGASRVLNLTESRPPSRPATPLADAGAQTAPPSADGRREAAAAHQKQEVAQLKSKVFNLNKGLFDSQQHAAKLQKELEYVRSKAAVSEFEKAKVHSEVKLLRARLEDCWCCSTAPAPVKARALGPAGMGSTGGMGMGGGNENRRPQTARAGPKPAQASLFEGFGRETREEAGAKKAKAGGGKGERRGPDTLIDERPSTAPAKGGRGSGGFGSLAFEDMMGGGPKVGPFDEERHHTLANIQFKASQSINKMIRQELVNLRQKYRDLAKQVSKDHNRSTYSLLDLKGNLAGKIEALEVALQSKFSLYDRNVEELIDKVSKIEDAASDVMGNQETLLGNLTERLNHELIEGKAKLADARAEGEKNESLIMLSQDRRIELLKEKLFSKEGEIMEKNRAILKELEHMHRELKDKAAEVVRAHGEIASQSKKIQHLEETLMAERHSLNLKTTDNDETREKLDKAAASLSAERKQREALQSDLVAAKVTAEEFINKYNVSVNQVERLEKSKWFLDKHATRLSRDFMELEEQHKDCTAELISTRSQCSYLLRDNHQMQMMMMRATKGVVEINTQFPALLELASTSEDVLDTVLAYIAVMKVQVDEEIDLGARYQAMSTEFYQSMLGLERDLSELKRTKHEQNERVKQLSVGHCQRLWHDIAALGTVSDPDQSDLRDAEGLDADGSIVEIVGHVHASVDKTVDVGKTAVSLHSQNVTAKRVLALTEEHVTKMLNGMQSLANKANRKLATFAKREETLRRKVLNYSIESERTKADLKKSNDAMGKRIKETTRTLQDTTVQLKEREYEIVEMKDKAEKQEKDHVTLKKSIDTFKERNYELMKEMKLRDLKIQRTEAEVARHKAIVNKATLNAAEYQVQIDVNKKKFVKKVENNIEFERKLKRVLTRELKTIRGEFNDLRDAVQMELMKSAAYLEYELSNDSSKLNQVKYFLRESVG